MLAETDAATTTWLDEYITGYVEQDLEQIFGAEFQQCSFPEIVADDRKQSGRKLEYRNVFKGARYCRTHGAALPGAFGRAFLVRRLLPWYVNTNKRLVRSPKVYIRDTGILHALVGIKSLYDLFGHTLAGNSWEGYVVEQIAQVLPSGIDPYFYRTHVGAEADLVLVKNEKPILAAEIKLNNSARPSRGFHESCKDLGNPMAWCITPESDRFPMGNGVEAIGLKEAVAAAQAL